MHVHPGPFPVHAAGVFGNLNMKVKKAIPQDLPLLVEFTSEEAREAESSLKAFDNLKEGVRKALEDGSKAMYWLLADDSGEAVGSISALKEWSDWNAGFYWWIQSVYIVPAQRGKGYFDLLLEAVVEEMETQGGLELRLYVHEDNERAIGAYKKSAFEKLPYEIMALKSGRKPVAGNASLQKTGRWRRRPHWTPVERK